MMRAMEKKGGMYVEVIDEGGFGWKILNFCSAGKDDSGM